MKTALAILILCSTAVAGDCRHVGQVYAVRQNVYGHGYVKAAIIAVEHDPYHVDLLAPELRAKQRQKEQAEELKAIREENRETKEELRTIKQLLLLKNGTDPGVLQQQSPDDEEAWKVLSSECAKCHTGEGAKGGQKFFNADNSRVKLSPLQWCLIEHTTNGREMPPGGNLADDKHQALRKGFENHRNEVRDFLKGKPAVPVSPAPGELK